MTLHVEIPDLLARETAELAARQHVSVDQVVATALAVQISAAASRPGIAERARRVNWQKVDEILARVPDRPPRPGDER